MCQTDCMQQRTFRCQSIIITMSVFVEKPISVTLEGSERCPLDGRAHIWEIRIREVTVLVPDTSCPKHSIASTSACRLMSPMLLFCQRQ